jgi:hypothetical protein
LELKDSWNIHDNPFISIYSHGYSMTFHMDKPGKKLRDLGVPTSEARLAELSDTWINRGLGGIIRQDASTYAIENGHL